MFRILALISFPVLLVGPVSGQEKHGRVPSTVDGVGVEVVGPNRITKNVPAEYKVLLKNRREQEASRLIVEVELSEKFVVQKTEPAGETIPGRIAWRIEMLAGNETKTLRFDAIAQEGGSGRVRAFVRQDGPAEDQADPINDLQPPELPATGDASEEKPQGLPDPLEPKDEPAELPAPEAKGAVKIELMMPETAVPGVPFVCEMVVTNSGRIPLSKMKFEMTPTKGLRVLRNFDGSAPKLPSEPGASIKSRVEMVSDGGGIQAVRAKLTAEPGVSEQVEREISISTSPFDLKLDLPAQHVMGQPLKLRLYVANNRNEKASGVQVFAVLPEGIEVVSGEAGALFNRRTRTVRWQAGEMQPEEERGFRLTVKPTLAGSFEFSARAEGDGGTLRDEAKETISVAGYVALGVNFEPSIDVATENQEVTLTFDVKSRGSKGAEGVVFQVEVIPGVELVGTGSSGWKEEDGWWKKSAAGDIPPGGQLQEKLVVRPTKPGLLSWKGMVTERGDTGPIIRVQPMIVTPAPPAVPIADPTPNGT
jgi:hypothetical protein